MAFPASPLGLSTELYLGPALGWVDITADVRLGSASSGGGVSIARGRPNEGSEPEVTRCALTLNQRSGKYSGRNPFSPYYGLLGRNTPIRLRVAEADPGGALAVDGRRGAGAQAPGAAVTAAHSSFDGPGDLDVRVWLRMPQWTDHDRVFVAGKDDAWSLAISDSGSLEFRWVNSSSVMTSTHSGLNRPVPASDGSLAIRATLVMATGVRTFYTAPSIAGPWTQLSQSTWGATSIKSGAYGIEVGRVSSFGDHGVNGELYAMELWMGGVLVASPDFRQLRAGSTQLVDAQGRTWTWSGGALPIDRGARYHGEVSSWPPRWDVSGRDVWVPIEAAGVTRRLSQGKSPVVSPLRRSLAATNPAGYLPLEDGEDASRPTSAAAGIGAGSSYKVEFGVEPGRLSGTSQVAKMLDFTSLISTPVVPRPASKLWSMLAFFKLASMPSGGDVTYLRLHMAGGTVARWDLQTSGGGYRFVGYNAAGAVVADQGAANGGRPPTNWTVMYLEISQSGGTVTWRPWWTNAGDKIYATIGPFTYAGSVGYPTKMEVVGSAYMQDGLVSHLAVADTNLLYVDNLALLSNGYAGETAGARISRLAAEEGVPLTMWGYPHDTMQLGPQPIAPLLDVLKDAARADGGILQDARGHLGLAYRTRASLYTQPAIGLSYSGGHIVPPFEPVEDDDAVRNAITVSRPNGGDATAVQTDGPLSVLPAPAGVGLYDTSETVNVYSDDQLPDHAYWRRHLGTVDEARYPRIKTDMAVSAMAADAQLTARVAQLDAGDVMAISGLPAWLPPGPITEMVQGYTETIDEYDWTITFNAAPASPFTVAVVDGAPRVAADGSTVAAAISAGALTLPLASTIDNGIWTEDPADFPLDLRVGAERVTASGAGPSLVDTFARTLASQLGAADSGQVWTTSGGAPADYSTNGSVGRISSGSVNVLRHALIDLGSADPTFVVDITNPLGTPSGAPVTHWVLFRAADTSNYYCARLDIRTNGSVDLVLLRRQAGALSGNLASAAGIGTHAASTWRVMVSAQGATLRAKAWKSTDVEPGWQVVATDTALTAGTLGGLAVRLESGNTNTLPVVVSLDNAQVVNPQAVTLSARAVNGVSRSWPAGTDVDVWQPAVLAL